MGKTSWWHEADHIRRLQQVHADHIDSIYRNLAELDDNPYGVEIHQLGDTRIFKANGPRLTNRVVLTGDESHEELDWVFEFYDNHHAGCAIEINPANFYPSDSDHTQSQIVPYLLSRGCQPTHFRCIWHREISAEPSAETLHPVITYSTETLEDYIEVVREVEIDQDWDEHAMFILAGERGADWFHYIAFINGTPAANASLYCADEIGYLSEAYTHPAQRRQGAHRALIQHRVRHAWELGCEGVFVITDSLTQSARDLQKNGFSLAYNYLLFFRFPQEE